jgi:hypothetical protein
VFELIDDPTAQQARYRELIRQHGPVCNAKQLNQALIHRITQARTVNKRLQRRPKETFSDRSLRAGI